MDRNLGAPARAAFRAAEQENNARALKKKKKTKRGIAQKARKLEGLSVSRSCQWDVGIDCSV